MDMNAFFQRSTKYASKQRRDQINIEVNEIREEIPVSDAVKRRLSQLQTMALCNAYIAKTNCFMNAVTILDDECKTKCVPHDFSEALPGFLIAITTDGKLLYISENVTEYLGHSMVDLMTQADSIYDVIDSPADQARLREFLLASRIKCDTVRDGSLDKLDFTCQMNLGKLFRRNNTFEREKMMKVSGRLIYPGGRLNLAEPIFVACCSPLLTCSPVDQPTVLQTMIFPSLHALDMTFMDVGQNGESHLGYSSCELVQRSWYQLIHPEDAMEAAQMHKELIQEEPESAKSLCIRVQTKHGHFVWLHTVMRLVGLNPDSIAQEISCLNHVLSEKEALETKQREHWEKMNFHRRTNSFEPMHQQQKESYRPMVSVEQGFLGHVRVEYQPTGQPFPKSVDCKTRQELLTKIRSKAQEKRGKMARISEPSFNSFENFRTAVVGSGDAFAESSNVQRFDSGQPKRSPERFLPQIKRNTKARSNFMTGLADAASDRYRVHSLLSPPLSENDQSDDCTIVQVTPPASRFNAASYTPPYSPPGSQFSYLDEGQESISNNNYDESSFFDTITLPYQKFPIEIQKPLTIPDDLPILDQCTIDSFFSGVESTDAAVAAAYSNFSHGQILSGSQCAPRDQVAMYQGLFQGQQLGAADGNRHRLHGQGVIGAGDAMDVKLENGDESFLEMLTGSWLMETDELFSTAELQNDF